MIFSFLIFWALVIFAVVLLVRQFGRPGRQPESTPPAGPSAPSGATAEHLLAERFARGEINDQEYRQRLSTLREASEVTVGDRS